MPTILQTQMRCSFLKGERVYAPEQRREEIDNELAQLKEQKEKWKLNVEEKWTEIDKERKEREKVQRLEQEKHLKEREELQEGWERMNQSLNEWFEREKEEEEREKNALRELQGALELIGTPEILIQELERARLSLLTLSSEEKKSYLKEPLFRVMVKGFLDRFLAIECADKIEIYITLFEWLKLYDRVDFEVEEDNDETKTINESGSSSDSNEEEDRSKICAQ